MCVPEKHRGQGRAKEARLSTQSEVLVVDQPLVAVCLAEPHRQDCLCHKMSRYNCRWPGALVCWEHDAVEERIPRRSPLLQELLQVHP
jgi:hypothetical protein